MSTAEQPVNSQVITPWTVADRIRKARRNPLNGSKMGQKAFAEAIGVTTQQLANWESGFAKPRDLAVYHRISEVTGYSGAWLAGFATDQDFSNISDWPILGVNLPLGQMELALDIGPPELRHVG